MIAARAASHAPRAALVAFVALVFVYLLLPTLFVVPMSFSNQLYLSFPPPGWSLRWYEAMWTNGDWARATLSSIAVGIPTALLSLVLGTLAALATLRGSLRWAATASAIIVAPMMLPHVILAVGLYPLLLKLGLLRSYVGVVIGHTVVAMPLVFITVSAALRNYPEQLELAAMTCGADRGRTFRHVTFPMIRVGMVSGFILAFATSFDELMLALFLTGSTTRTLPRLIWEQLNYYLTPAIAAVATLLLAFSLVLLAIVAVLGRRSGAAAMVRA
jgi:ABC-type spermidine/putrescine transport system permease subunit II